jgi:hypothetical protein
MRLRSLHELVSKCSEIQSIMQIPRAHPIIWQGSRHTSLIHGQCSGRHRTGSQPQTRSLPLPPWRVRGGDERIPELAWACILALAEQLVLIKRQILEMDLRITACHGASEVSRRLAEIPGVGPLLASALVAHVRNPKAFSSGRNPAAWIGPGRSVQSLANGEPSTQGHEELSKKDKVGTYNGTGLSRAERVRRSDGE